MGTKRIGLARVEALMENLKRELQLSGSVVCGLQGASHGSFGSPPIVIDDDSTDAAGTDAQTMIHQYYLPLPVGLEVYCNMIYLKNSYYLNLLFHKGSHAICLT